MTDPWARPTGDRRVVEVELSGGDHASHAVRPGADPPPSSPAARSRRRAALLAVGALLGAGVVAAVTAGGDGGDGDAAVDGSATTLDSSQITTPPTLPLLDTLPPVTRPGTNGTPGRGTNPGVDAPDLTFPGENPFDPTTVTLPTFDVVPGVTEDDLAGYDLLGAVAANAPGGTPMRTFVTLEGIQNDGLFNSEAQATVSSDPVAGRDSLDISRNVGEAASIVADRAAGVVYRTDEGLLPQWETFSTDVFTRGTGTDDLDALFDSLVTGPITADAIAAAIDVVDTRTLLRLDGGAIARQFQVTVPIDALRPYGLLLLANVSEATVEEGVVPDFLTFDVYVTDQPRLALVATRFESDGITYVIEQFFDRRPANVIIDLPAADAVIDGAVTGAPAPAPTTLPSAVPAGTVP